jgi:hypothetical protein
MTALCLLVVSASANDPGPIATQVKFDISEKGGFWEHTIPQLGSKEMAAMITAACAVFEVDCSQEAVAATEAIKKLSASDKQEGEEHHGIIRAPVGYEICKAKADWKNASITGEVTFNTRIVRTPNDNGLGYYAVVPKNRSSGQWVETMLYLEFVPAGKTGQYGCWATDTIPWLCKGQNCSQVYPGSRV